MQVFSKLAAPFEDLQLLPVRSQLKKFQREYMQCYLPTYHFYNKKGKNFSFLSFFYILSLEVGYVLESY